MPHIITDLERSKEFKAVRALLLYESGGDSAFCTVHDVESGTLRPGRPITAGEVREALARISGMSERICILPPNVLVSGNGILAWHRPAKPATLWFSMLSKHGKPDRKHPLSKLSGSKFPMPPLLWMVKGGRLHLWAMPHGQRPTGKTRLHPTPFIPSAQRRSPGQGQALT